MIYTVYTINYQSVPVYIGHTNNLKRRTYQHNYDCYKKQVKKPLYDWIRQQGIAEQIHLIPIKSFKTKTDAKRFETYLILQDYFEEKKLKQKVPSISDR